MKSTFLTFSFLTLACSSSCYICREEVERQLIKTSEDRLVRIEDDNITKVRLHRSISQSDKTDVSQLNCSEVDDITAFWSTNAQSANNGLDGHIRRSSDTDLSNVDNMFLGGNRSGIKNNRRSNEKFGQNGSLQQSRSDGSLENSSSLGEDAVDAESFSSSSSVSLIMNPETVAQLEEEFGSIEGRPLGKLLHRFVVAKI